MKKILIFILIVSAHGCFAKDEIRYCQMKENKSIIYTKKFSKMEVLGEVHDYSIIPVDLLRDFDKKPLYRVHEIAWDKWIPTEDEAPLSRWISKDACKIIPEAEVPQVDVVYFYTEKLKVPLITLYPKTPTNNGKLFLFKGDVIAYGVRENLYLNKLLGFHPTQENRIVYSLGKVNRKENNNMDLIFEEYGTYTESTFIPIKGTKFKTQIIISCMNNENKNGVDLICKSQGNVDLYGYFLKTYLLFF